MAAVVQALNLSKVYHLGDERVYALNDVSLEVYSGELVAIVGTEGSGKSTLLHPLASLRKPDSGTVRIEEFDLTQMDYEALAQIRAHKIGFLFQAFNLLPNETAQANVEVSLPPLGWGRQGAPPKGREGPSTCGVGGPPKESPRPAFSRTTHKCSHRPGDGPQPSGTFLR